LSMCVCVSVCLSVCPHVYLTNDISKLHEILCTWPVDRSSSDDVAVCYIPAVFVHYVMFSHSQRGKVNVYSKRFTRGQHRGVKSDENDYLVNLMFLVIVSLSHTGCLAVENLPSKLP